LNQVFIIFYIILYYILFLSYKADLAKRVAGIKEPSSIIVTGAATGGTFICALSENKLNT
jgi:hypothetical protein